MANHFVNHTGRKYRITHANVSPQTIQWANLHASVRPTTVNKAVKTEGLSLLASTSLEAAEKEEKKESKVRFTGQKESVLAFSLRHIRSASLSSIQNFAAIERDTCNEVVLKVATALYTMPAAVVSKAKEMTEKHSENLLSSQDIIKETQPAAVQGSTETPAKLSLAQIGGSDFKDALKNIFEKRRGVKFLFKCCLHILILN